MAKEQSYRRTSFFDKHTMKNENNHVLFDGYPGFDVCQLTSTYENVMIRSRSGEEKEVLMFYHLKDASFEFCYKDLDFERCMTKESKDYVTVKI